MRLRGGRGALGRASALLLGLTLAASGCERSPPDGTPEGAVRELLDRLARLDGDEAAGRQALALLSSRARANLAERALRSGHASGRKVAPEAMLVPARTGKRFQPQTMRAEIAGARALVTVAGVDPSREAARIPCVFEEGAWRVDITLPAPPPIERGPRL